jgi:hypothetical protein
MQSSASAVAPDLAGTHLRAWRERVRDPRLTALLIIQLCVIFVAAPLAALGLPWARPVGEGLVLALVLIVVTLSNAAAPSSRSSSGLGPYWPTSYS